MITGTGDPWSNANETERLQALALVERYGDEAEWTTAGLAEFYGTTEAPIRNARWLAVTAGLLVKSRGRWNVTDKARGLAS
ncbi:hypothetical protein [Nocardioides pyridinolyticus]